MNSHNLYNQNSISSVRKELKRDQLSLKNRLQSILYDSFFIASLKDISSELAQFPLVPNERCGLWYVPNEKQVESSYFKSTDGHTNEWKFSMRRLNFHLLPLIAKNQGISIIDSTRKGKLMPDALSKTIPIWCAVLNSILYEGVGDEDIRKEIEDQFGDTKEDVISIVLGLKNENQWLRTPKEMVSRSEHNSIMKRIDGFVHEVKHLGLIDKEQLLSALGGNRKPLIPSWLYPGCKLLTSGQEESFVFEEEVTDEVKQQPYYSIQCVTASKKTSDGESASICVRRRLENEELVSTSWNYVQGSADDHELWATNDICKGELSPKLFWELLSLKDSKNNIVDEETGYIYDWLSEEDLVKRMNSLYSEYYSTKENQRRTLDVSSISNSSRNTGIALGKIEADIKYNDLVRDFPNAAQVIILSDKFKILELPEKEGISIYSYKIESSKKGSKQLREVFPSLVPQLKINPQTKNNLLVLCDTGKDIGAGLVLLLLCMHFGLDWNPTNETPRIDKDIIKKQLSSLANIRKVNPSRNTLQSVNTYLM
ncbi:tRNA A64-2'-O-ribosylphosphate transferase [Scheffersomyces xylosifermentans]|uniref:tRNA A64-2'-O-ribosylphosphate transferase n=1 Tax=Scheffersomyces xylosifermentans TaxID=1304137 RepID=UPI00315CFB38